MSSTLTTTFHGNQILDRIEHRFENVLIDSVVMEKLPDHVRGTLSLTISDQDPRALFFQTTQIGLTLLPSVYMEIAALASIVCTEYNREHLIVFASISQFVVHHTWLINTPLTGIVLKGKEKGGFIRCQATLTCQNNPVATGHLMAYIIDPSKLGGTPTSKLGSTPLLTENTPIPTTLFHRDPAMVWVHHVRHFTPNTLVTDYTYPASHPLTRGHFPDKPIMMGVMQLQAMEDSILVFGLRSGLTHTTITADAEIIRDDTQAVVCEAKRLTIRLYEYQSQLASQLVSVDKIAFRDPVQPNTRLFIHLKNIIWAS